jgi:hypothetical protein
MSLGMSPWHSSKLTATPEPDHASVGTPAACARIVEPICKAHHSKRKRGACWSRVEPWTLGTAAAGLTRCKHALGLLRNGAQLPRTLSPRAAMAFAGGPRNLMPLALRASGSSGFSDAWPLRVLVDASPLRVAQQAPTGGADVACPVLHSERNPRSDSWQPSCTRLGALTSLATPRPHQRAPRPAR